MSLTDYRTAINTKLWALLEASTEVTSRVTSGNRVNLDKQAGWLRTLFQGAGSSDFPSITITTGKLMNAGFTTTVNFGMNALPFSASAVPWVQERVYGFSVRIVTDNRKIGDSDTLEEAVMLALLAGGPKLGLSYVVEWKMSGTQQMQTRQEARGTYRLVSDIDLTIRMRLDGPTYLA